MGLHFYTTVVGDVVIRKFEAQSLPASVGDVRMFEGIEQSPERLFVCEDDTSNHKQQQQQHHPQQPPPQPPLPPPQ